MEKRMLHNDREGVNRRDFKKRTRVTHKTGTKLQKILKVKSK